MRALQSKELLLSLFPEIYREFKSAVKKSFKGFRREAGILTPYHLETFPGQDISAVGSVGNDFCWFCQLNSFSALGRSRRHCSADSSERIPRGKKERETEYHHVHICVHTHTCTHTENHVNDSSILLFSAMLLTLWLCRCVGLL